MSTQSPRHWVGFLNNDKEGGPVLYDRASPDRSVHDVYLYHFGRDTIINHFKYSVKARLRPLEDHEMHSGRKVIDAYLKYKLRYFRHLVIHRERGLTLAIPTEFLGLSQTNGDGPWEPFHGDPDWELLR